MTKSFGLVVITFIQSSIENQSTANFCKSKLVKLSRCPFLVSMIFSRDPFTGEGLCCRFQIYHRTYVNLLNQFRKVSKHPKQREYFEIILIEEGDRRQLACL